MPETLAFDPARFAALGTLQLQARYVMEGFLQGIHASPFHGPSVEFADYRDYQPGDEPRHIDWRLYARNDRLAVKRFEQETNARCLLLVDTSASMTYRGARAWGSKLDAARILAAALAWLLLRQNDAVGLLAARDVDEDLIYWRPSQKRSQLGRLLGALDALESSGAASLDRLLDQGARLMGRRGLIVLLSDLLDASSGIESTLKRLRFDGHEVLALQVLDPDELEFPWQGATVFEDLETGARRQVMGDHVRTLYLERLKAFLETYRQLFEGLEMPYATLRTDADPGQGLGRFLTGRRRR